MALLTTQGIVFRRIKYGETSLITDIYTAEKGLHSFIAGGVRKTKSRMPLGLFHAMAPVELVAYFKEDSEKLHRLKEIRPLTTLQRIPFNLSQGAIALFMAEVCQKTIQETESAPNLFNFLLDYVLFLDSSEAPLANLHLHFLLGLSEHLGFRPSPRGGDEPFFDLREGESLYTIPPHTEYFSGEALDDLYALLDATKENCHKISLEAFDRKLLLQHLLHFYRLHSPGFSEIHTPSILAQVFG